MASNSPSAIASTDTDTSKSKKTPELPSRVRKCPSCRIPHTEHTFGQPGPQCTGPESSGEGTQQQSPGRHNSSTISNDALVDKSAQVTYYKKQLELLEQEEQRVLSEINNEENLLLQQIEQKKREIDLLKARRLQSQSIQSTNSSVSASRHQPAPTPTSQATTNAAILPSLFDDDRPVRPQVLQSGSLLENSRGHLSDPLAL
eukprot:TCONS_00021232-protein